jgi:hypothetical protein
VKQAGRSFRYKSFTGVDDSHSTVAQSSVIFRIVELNVRPVIPNLVTLSKAWAEGWKLQLGRPMSSTDHLLDYGKPTSPPLLYCNCVPALT